MSSPIEAEEICRHGSILMGRYEIDELLGIGGMANVYRAFDRENENRLVALKMLHKQLLDYDDYVQRFIREVRLLSQIDHPNVVEVDNIHYEHGNVFYTMEFLEGITLEEHLLDYSFDPLFAVRVLKE